MPAFGPHVSLVTVTVQTVKISRFLPRRSRGTQLSLRRCWLWRVRAEGVSMYLSRAGVTGTLETIRAMSGAGSEVVMDCWYLPDEPSLVSSARRWSTNLLSLLGEPVTFSLHPEDAEPFLHRLGFRLRELADAEILRRRYFRKRTHLYPTNYVVHAVVDGVGPQKGGREGVSAPRVRARRRRPN